MRVPLNASTLGSEEIEAATEVLKSTFVTMGKNCKAFEREFAEYIGSKHAIYVNSGSSANLLAFFALAYPLENLETNKRFLTPGKEVIVPALTWSTTVWPIVHAGGIPVLVDADPSTLQMRENLIEDAMSDDTVAVCPVHILGNSSNINQMKKITDKNNLWMIEDCCESLGIKNNGKFVGTYGDIGTYSFFFSHHITSVEGGMIVTNDDGLADTMRSLRAHGWSRGLDSQEYFSKKYSHIDDRYLFINTGFNVRPTDINASIGRIQLRKLEKFNIERDRIEKYWKSELSNFEECGELEFIKTTEGTEAHLFGFPVLCKNNETRNKFQAHLEKNNIETRPIIAGNLARQPAFSRIKHRISGELRGADRIMDCGLYWGLHPVMKENEVEYVVETIRGFFK